jgi:hypothetical protein
MLASVHASAIETIDRLLARGAELNVQSIVSARKYDELSVASK